MVKLKGLEELAIGNNIQKLLTDKGVSISQFSRDADLSWVTAHDLYHNKSKSVSFDILNRLCNYFGVGPSELFPFSPDKKSRVRKDDD